MKVCEIFESISGEGKYIGEPALFIRLSGCTRNCEFCDTNYHTDGKQMTIKQIIKKIQNSECETIIWTGGEPMLQETDIYDVIFNTNNKYHHLETNGDILPQSPGLFQYICFSPKEKRVADNVYSYCLQLKDVEWDIKIVTDLDLNKDMIDNATILMPLTTKYDAFNLLNKHKVWNYCVKNKIKYSPRIHVDVWGNTKGR